MNANPWLKIADKDWILENWQCWNKQTFVCQSLKWTISLHYSHFKIFTDHFKYIRQMPECRNGLANKGRTALSAMRLLPPRPFFNAFHPGPRWPLTALRWLQFRRLFAGKSGVFIFKCRHVLRLKRHPSLLIADLSAACTFFWSEAFWNAPIALPPWHTQPNNRH